MQHDRPMTCALLWHAQVLAAGQLPHDATAHLDTLAVIVDEALVAIALDGELQAAMRVVRKVLEAAVRTQIRSRQVWRRGRHHAGSATEYSTPRKGTKTRIICSMMRLCDAAIREGAGGSIDLRTAMLIRRQVRWMSEW